MAHLQTLTTGIAYHVISRFHSNSQMYYGALAELQFRFGRPEITVKIPSPPPEISSTIDTATSHFCRVFKFDHKNCGTSPVAAFHQRPEFDTYVQFALIKLPPA